MRWLFSYFIILSQVSDYNRVIFIEGEDAEIERVLKERGEASEREDDTEVISKTKLEVYNGNTRPISDSLGDSDKALKVCTWWSRSICLLRLIMLAFFLEGSTHFVAQYIPHIVFPFRRFYVTKFLVTTGFRSVARIFQRVRVGWGGVGWGQTESHPGPTWLSCLRSPWVSTKANFVGWPLSDADCVDSSHSRCFDTLS